jgi:RNA polymerase sigma-70 factor, ECF subfamily
MLSFHELYERHARDVFRFALFLTGNPATADDLVSETFVRAWTARGSIREASVRAYLLTIARNLWRDMLRRESRLVPLEEAAGQSIAAAGDQAADWSWTARQLGQVAAGDREALLLYARDGMTYEEVARALDISVGAVKSRIFRARQLLAALRNDGESEKGAGS